MSQKDVLKELMAEFDRQGVAYCFLRNYGFLLNDSMESGKDIDVLILAEHLPVIDRVLKRFGFFSGRARGETKHVYYGKHLSQGAPILTLDFHVEDLSWYEVPYISGLQVMERRVRQNGIFLPSREDNLLMLLIHSSLNGTFKSNYIKTIESILSGKKIEQEYIEKTLRSLWHNSLLQRVWHLLLQGEYQKIVALRPYLICSLLLKRSGHLARFIKYLFITRIIEKMRPLLSSTNLVGFMGVDGSGKTTAAKGLRSILETNGIKTDIVYMGRWRNQILPLATGSQKYGMTGIRSPKKKEGLKFKIYCILRDVTYLMDMWLRYWVKLYPKMKKGYTIITDRYVYDLLLDNNCTTVCRAVVKHLFPKPFIVFHLTNEPEIIWKRKKELTVEEMARQMKILASVRQFYSVIEVKSDEIDKTIDTVARAYFCRLAS